MQLIPIAKKVEFNKETAHKGQFVIEPLFPGYGLTLGNALRRVLFSSMPGAAITSVKIIGSGKMIEHEFSTIDYVKEDVVDILLNIKQINISIDGDIPSDEDKPFVLKIEKKGEGEITAADLICPTQVVVANPAQPIATITDAAGSLEMEFTVDKGMGYESIENREKGKYDIGHLAIDSIYTPINNVAMSTEHVRVGEMTNWDKLTLDIETNGTITCEEAFNLAVKILVQQFSALVPEESLIEEFSPKDEGALEENEAESEKKKKEEKKDEIETGEAVAKPKKRGRPKKTE